MKTLAIIMAGGSGTRTGGSIPKQFIHIGSKSMLEMVVDTFHSHPEIDAIFIVCKREYLNHVQDLVRTGNYGKVEKLISGGKTRQLSVMNGIFSVEKDIEKILIHDSARPFVSQHLIGRVLSALDKYSAVTPVIDSTDTLVSLRDNHNVLNFPDRKSVKRVQTPQGFRQETILKAHRSAERDKRFDFTDDCSMVFHYQLADIFTVEGETGNLKITSPDELERLRHSIEGGVNDRQV